MNAHVALEMLARYTTSLERLSSWAYPALALALLATYVPALVPVRHARFMRGAFVAIAIVYGLVQAWSLRWLCDDAFISFRYSDNLARGHGLVFNLGERVEGYTNFLWTVLLAGAVAVGLDIGQTSIVIGLACYALLIGMTARTATRALPAALGRDVPGHIPLAAILCGAQLTLATFATSGLETMFAALLALLALERAIAGSFVLSGLCGVLAAMTHPDHGILYASLGLAIVLHAPSRKQIFHYAAPFLCVYLPYFAWRYAYYGDLFPNTYYAKSASLAYFDQGATYLSAFFLGTGFWLALPLALLGAWRARRELLGSYVLIAVPLFSLYIAKIGGDFMHGRLLCPLIAPMLLVIELGVRSLRAERLRLRVLLASLIAVFLIVPTNLFRPMEKKWHLADERTFYPLKSFDPIRVTSVYADWARDLTKVWKPNAAFPRLAMRCVGMVGYYTGWPLVDGFGLTDPWVARRPLWKRGRPGHEKAISPAYAVLRDVDISDDPVHPPPYTRLTRISIKKTGLYLVRYDPKVIAELDKAKDTSFIDYEKQLRTELRPSPRPGEPEKAACDSWFAETYYFARVPSSPLRARSTHRLLMAGRPLLIPAGEQALIVRDFESTHAPDRASKIGFEPGESIGFRATGDAFATHPMRGESIGQDLITGYHGALLNTFIPGRGDGAVGTLRSEPFTLVGDVMTLQIGGGRHQESLRVSLLVDGERQFSAGGCMTEMMGRRVWQISRFKGKQAVLEIVDHLQGPWGHIVLDEIVQWVPKPGSAAKVELVPSVPAPTPAAAAAPRAAPKVTREAPKPAARPAVPKPPVTKPAVPKPPVATPPVAKPALVPSTAAPAR